MKIFLSFLFIFYSSLAFAHSPYEADLRECMDTKYGIGNWTQRTSAGVGTDIGPAISDCLNALRSTVGRGILKIPPGAWLMNTGIASDVLSGHTIQGVSSQSSIIYYNKFSGAAFWWSGHQGYSGGGMKNVALLIEEGMGNSNAYAIVLQGDAVYQPDQMTFEDLYITTASATTYWWEALHIDGSARSNPRGVRGIDISLSYFFNNRNVGFYISNGVGITLTNVGTFTGSGTYGNRTLIINSTEIRSIGLWSTPNVSNSTNINLN